MSLRKKTIIAIAIILLLTMVVGYGYTHIFFMNAYLNLEQQQIKANVRRFHNALDSEIYYLDKLTNDWAGWDDTYIFMQDNNQNYFESNLLDDTYSELDLNFSFFLDEKGKLVFEKEFDLEKGVEIPVEESILTYLKKIVAASPLFEAGDFIHGVFSNDGMPVIFAARPILTSLDEGPSHGTLIFGKMISGSLFERIKSSVDSEVIILPYSAEAFEGFPKSKSDQVFRVDLSNPDIAFFYSVIRDVNGLPVIIIEQTLPRNIYQQGLASRREFLIALLIGCLVAGAFVIFALEYVFLKRFTKLSRTVKSFESFQQENDPAILKGGDELTNLSIEMQNAFSHLTETQDELKTHLDFEKLLVGISTKFINLPVASVDEGIIRLLNVIGDYSKADRGHVRLLRPGTSDIMDVTHEWCADGIPSVKESCQNVRIDPSSWWMNTLKTGKPILINDINDMPNEARKEMDLFRSQSTQSLAVIPMIINGEFVGFLAYNLVKEKRIGLNKPFSYCR